MERGTGLTVGDHDAIAPADEIGKRDLAAGFGCRRADALADDFRGVVERVPTV